MRTLLIAGNWKMNPATRAEAVALAEAVKVGSRPGDERARRSLSAGCLSGRGRLGPGGHADRPGRPEHALGAGRRVYRRGFRRRCWSTAGCTHVILGHSERRHGMGETDASGERQAARRPWPSG